MPKIVVGLGNPGRQYAGTRHNVGYAVIDNLTQSPCTGRFQSRFEAQVAEVLEDSGKVLLAKPETFMNLSGRSVRQLTDFYRVTAEDMLVVCDDINLPLGRLRIRTQGTHGGHNGLRSIQDHLGSTAYPRLRIGINAPAGDDAIEHVLGRFRPAERGMIDDAIQRAVQAVVVWIHQGIDACMNEFNGE